MESWLYKVIAYNEVPPFAERTLHGEIVPVVTCPLRRSLMCAVISAFEAAQRNKSAAKRILLRPEYLDHRTWLVQFGFLAKEHMLPPTGHAHDRTAQLALMMQMNPVIRTTAESAAAVVQFIKKSHPRWNDFVDGKAGSRTTKGRPLVMHFVENATHSDNTLMSSPAELESVERVFTLLEKASSTDFLIEFLQQAFLAQCNIHVRVQLAPCTKYGLSNLSVSTWSWLEWPASRNAPLGTNMCAMTISFNTDVATVTLDAAATMAATTCDVAKDEPVPPPISCYEWFSRERGWLVDVIQNERRCALSGNMPTYSPALPPCV